MLDRDAIRLRIEATKDATSRSRFALLASTIAALSLLIAEFNAYISWNRDFALASVFSAPDTPTGMAQRKLLDDWVSSTSMNVSFLGIHLNASDATILGGTALFFLTLWFFYSMRRENRLVGTLLRSTRDATYDLMDVVYSGIVSYMVFTAVRPGKPAIDTLEQDLPKESRKTWLKGVQLLFWLPIVAIAMSLFFDFMSILALAAPFRDGHEIPSPHGWDLVKFVVYSLVGLACLVATLTNSVRIHRLDKATGTVLRTYGNILKAKKELISRLAGWNKEDAMSEAVPSDPNGISVRVRLDPTFPPSVDVKVDDERIRALLLKAERKADLDSHYRKGRLVWRVESERNVVISSIGAEGQAAEEQIEFVAREAFRLPRLIRGQVQRDRDAARSITDRPSPP
jgi:hypothetical protein